MSTVVSRTFASVPARSATETWAAIAALLAPVAGSAARRELDAVVGLAASLIARESFTAAAVCHGAGPRVRVYCLYHEDALERDGVNERALSFDPTDGDWRLSLPCPAEDLEWVRRRLAQVSTRITVRSHTEDVLDERRAEGGAATPQAGAARNLVDVEAFRRP